MCVPCVNVGHLKFKCKDKGKVFPLTDREGPEGE